jgi:hypothetical protein
VSQKTTADLINRFPLKEQRVTLAGLEEEGFILFAGVGLLFASFFPSRWRARATDDDSGYEYGLPESSEPYGEPGVGGARHAVRDEPVSPAYGSQQGGYDPQRTSYDPLYEPTQQQQQQPYGRRSPFIPPDESGGTREMHRPD